MSEQEQVLNEHDGFAVSDMEDESQVTAAEQSIEEPQAVEPEVGEPPVAASPDWESKFRELEERIEAIPQPEPPPPPDLFAQFRVDYPDIAEPIEKIVSQQQRQFADAISALRVQAFEETMDTAYPRWRDVRRSPEFETWLEKHPDQYKIAQQPGARAALQVLRKYDEHHKAVQVKTQRDSRLKAAQATPSKGTTTPTPSDSYDGWAAS